MKDYDSKQGKFGPILYVGNGVKVAMTKDGSWEVEVNKEGERVRRRYRKDNEKAVMAAELIIKKLGLGFCEEPKEYLFKEAADDWFKANAQRWSPSTQERYHSLLRDFVLPVLGEKPLVKVSKKKVKELLAELFTIRAAKTVELVHAVISGVFREAIDNELASKNPAQGVLRKVLPPKHKRSESTPDPLSRDDLSSVLLAAGHTSTQWLRS